MRVVVHRSGIVYMMTIGPIARSAERAAGRIRDRAKENAPVDTGELRNSIISERQPAGATHIVWRVGSSLNYALYQELGTGPIYARRAPFLVFKVDGRWVKTYSTKGVPAARFLTRAVERTTSEDFL